MSASTPRIDLDPYLSSLHVKWVSLLAEMHSFVVHAAPTDERMFATQLNEAEVRHQWLMHYNKRSHALLDVDLSCADLLFTILCYAMCCANHHIRGMALLSDTRDLCARMCILGSRHTEEVRSQATDYEAVEPLFHHVASWVCRYGSVPAATLTTALHRLDSESPLSTPVRTSLHGLMCMPHLDHMRTDDDRKQEADQLLQEKLDAVRPSIFAKVQRLVHLSVEAQEEDDQEQSSQKGIFWLVDIPMMIVGFIPFASRIFHQVSLEQYIFSRYPVSPTDVFAYPPRALVNLRLMVSRRTSLHAADSFKSDFRMFVFRWYMPMGSLSMRYRSIHTEHERVASDTMIERELGLDTTQALHNLVNVKLPTIVDNAQHELHELLMMYTLHSMMVQECGVDFFASFVIASCDLPVDHAVLATTRESYSSRRPRIVFILQQPWIHEQGHWYKCNGIVDAVLKLLVMMRRAWRLYPDEDEAKASLYNSCVARNEVSIASICESVLGPQLAVDLIPWTTE